jgi:hypothetical protein
MAQGGTQHVDHVRGGRRRPDSLRQRTHPRVQPRRDGETTIGSGFRRLADELLAGLFGGLRGAESTTADTLTADPDREVPGTVIRIGSQARAVVAVAAAGGGVGAAASTVVRLAAGQAIAAGWPNDPDTLPLLRDRATTDSDGDVRRAAVQAIGRMGAR